MRVLITRPPWLNFLKSSISCILLLIRKTGPFLKYDTIFCHQSSAADGIAIFVHLFHRHNRTQKMDYLLPDSNPQRFCCDAGNHLLLIQHIGPKRISVISRYNFVKILRDFLHHSYLHLLTISLPGR